jgi:hypothetical protein
MRVPNLSDQRPSKKTELVGLCICSIFAIAALQFLLVKLTMVYFAGLFHYTDWTWKEMLLFFGFANQLSGIALSTETQMLRILLFKFGGEDTYWQKTEIEACATYLHYFARRLVEQLGCLRALMVFWTMTSADLQSLFQGKLRYLEQAAVRDEEIMMMQKLNSRGDLVAHRDSLLLGSKEVELEMDELLNEARPCDRMELLQTSQSRMIGQLRLAARVQEHIWEWRQSQFEKGFDAPLSGDRRAVDSDLVVTHF